MKTRLMRAGAFPTVAFMGIIALWNMKCSHQAATPDGHALKVEPSTVSESASVNLAADSLERRETYEEREGRALYTKYCVVCHGAEGKGDGFNAYNLDPKPRDFTDSRYMSTLADDRIIQTITGGGRSVNRSSLMPSWGGRMQKEEIRYVVAYVRSFGSVAKPADTK